MRRLSARTTPTALAAIALPTLMVMITPTPATAAAAPTIDVAAGFDFPEIAACNPDGNGATIPLEVADPDGTPGELTLTGASSNQSLLPDAAITFGGADAIRSVTLAVVPNETGQADVTITVSDGVATDTVLIRTFADGPAGQREKFGTLDNDLMLGQGGSDHLISGISSLPKPPPGSTGRDVLCGGDGNDHLEGQDEEDTVDGQAGDDIVKGAQGNDIVRGGSGNDRISGRGGSDLYSCGEGVDMLYGYRPTPEPPAQPDTNDGTCEQIPTTALASSD